MAPPSFVESVSIKTPVPPLRLGLVVTGREKREMQGLKSEVPPTFPGRAGALGSFPAKHSPLCNSAEVGGWQESRIFEAPGCLFISGSCDLRSSILSQLRALVMDFTFGIWSTCGVVSLCAKSTPPEAD